MTLTVASHFYNPDGTDTGLGPLVTSTVPTSGKCICTTPFYVQNNYADPQTSQTTTRVCRVRGFECGVGGLERYHGPDQLGRQQREEHLAGVVFPQQGPEGGL